MSIKIPLQGVLKGILLYKGKIKHNNTQQETNSPIIVNWKRFREQHHIKVAGSNKQCSTITLNIIISIVQNRAPNNILD